MADSATNLGIYVAVDSDQEQCQWIEVQESQLSIGSPCFQPGLGSKRQAEDERKTNLMG